MKFLKIAFFGSLILLPLAALYVDYLRAELENSRQLLSQKDQEIVTLTLKNGDQVQRIQTEEATKENLKILLQPYQDDLKAQGIKLKNVTELLKVGFKAHGVVSNQVVTSYYFRDSIHVDTVRKWRFDDGFLTMDCSDTNGVATCPYSVTDTVTVISHDEKFKLFVPRTWLRKNRKSFTDVRFSSGKIKATSIRHIRK